jgi:hypothetical protein
MVEKKEKEEKVKEKERDRIHHPLSLEGARTRPAQVVDRGPALQEKQYRRTLPNCANST